MKIKLWKIFNAIYMILLVVILFVIDQYFLCTSGANSVYKKSKTCVFKMF